MGSGAMLHIQSFIQICSAIQNFDVRWIQAAVVISQFLKTREKG
jgi:hypothetical protein